MDSGTRVRGGRFSRVQVSAQGPRFLNQVMGQLPPGYFVPARGDVSIVVLHEAYGLHSPSSHIPQFCQRLSDAGYTAFAPDLHRGTLAVGVEDALRLMKALREREAFAVIQAAIHALGRTTSTPVVVIELCMGGAWSFRSALAFEDLAGAVMFYATPRGNPDCLKVPLLGHFALNDDFVPIDTVRAFESRLITAGKTAIFHYYDAEHSFMDERRSTFSPTAAALAWNRTRQFLKQLV